MKTPMIKRATRRLAASIAIITVLATSSALAADWTDANNVTYTALKSIKAEGGSSGAFLNTTIRPTGAETVKFRLKPTATATQFIFCSRTASTIATGVHFNGLIASGKLRVDRKNTAATCDTTALSVNTEHKVVADFGAGTVSIDDNDQGVSLGTDSYTPTTDIRLYTDNNGSNRGSFHLYYFQMYSSAGVLQYNLMPAKRDTDSVVGLYDTVNRKFYPNSGVTAFTSEGRTVTVTGTPVKWTGLGDGVSMSDGANWEGGVAPGAGQDIDFTLAPPLAEINANISGCTFGKLWVDDGDIPAFTGSMIVSDVNLPEKVSGNAAILSIATAWELADDTTWSALVAQYGAPDADAGVLIVASDKYTLTIDENVAVGQLAFTGTNPNVVVNSGCTVTTDTINFGAANTDYYVLNNGAIVLNGTGITSMKFHNDSRGVYSVNAGRLQVSGVTDGNTTPGLVPGGANQFVNVASGAMYDVNGVADNTASVRLAAGATVANGGTSSVVTGNKQIPQLILDGDATAKIHRSFGIVATGHAESRLDLGEHTLTITGGGNTYSFFLDNTTVSGTGEILVEEGKLCAVENAGGEEFTLEIGSSGQLVLDRVNRYWTYTDFTVGNFVNNGTDISAAEAGALIVKGTLTPGNAINKLTLANGSTVKATGTAQIISIAFAASGTVVIDASAITKAQLEEAEDQRIPVLTVPTANKGGIWTVATPPVSGARAKWVDNGNTSTLYLCKSQGTIFIIR